MENIKNAEQLEIANQIQFYFTRINEDRYLQRKYEQSEGGYVPLQVIMTFKKLKALTRDIKIVRRSIEKYASDTLELNRDRDSVRPIEKLEISGYFRDRTVYLENLPRNITREILKEKFEIIVGKVEYVEMEYAKENELNKGFAFIEFQLVSSVASTLGLLGRPGESTRNAIRDNLEQYHSIFEEVKNWGLRVWTKMEWLRLMDEYRELLEMRSRIKQVQNGTDYTPSTFIHFQNVCIDSNKGVLNALFGKVVPNEPKYIDYDPSQTEVFISSFLASLSQSLLKGYMRCSNAEASRKLVTQFEKHMVKQKSCGDTEGEPTNSKEESLKLSIVDMDTELKLWDAALSDRRDYNRRKEARDERLQKQVAKERRVKKLKGASGKKSTKMDEDDVKHEHKRFRTDSESDVLALEDLVESSKRQKL